METFQCNILRHTYLESNSPFAPARIVATVDHSHHIGYIALSKLQCVPPIPVMHTKKHMIQSD